MGGMGMTMAPPAAKRQRTTPTMDGMSGGLMSGGMGGASVVSSGEPSKDQLVFKVKAFQRSSEEQKQAWWTHCDTSLAGVRDPARHDATTLQAFLSSHGVY